MRVQLKSTCSSRCQCHLPPGRSLRGAGPEGGGGRWRGGREGRSPRPGPRAGSPARRLLPAAAAGCGRSGTPVSALRTGTGGSFLLYQGRQLWTPAQPSEGRLQGLPPPRPGAICFPSLGLECRTNRAAWERRGSGAPLPTPQHFRSLKCTPLSRGRGGGGEATGLPSREPSRRQGTALHGLLCTGLDGRDTTGGGTRRGDRGHERAAGGSWQQLAALAEGPVRTV